MGWKQPYNYPLAECEFCACAEGQAEQAYWQRKAAAEQQAKIGRLFSNAGLPTHLRDLTVETMATLAGPDRGKKAALRAAREYIEQGYVLGGRSKKVKIGLVLAGAYGMGKTGLLTPVLRHFVEQGKGGLWIEYYEFVREIQKGYTDGESSARLEAAQRIDYLLLDDLGDATRTTPETDDRRRLTFELINHRHNWRLPMLITTNLTPASMGEQFGQRTLERIMESCAWIEVGGKNLRHE